MTAMRKITAFGLGAFALLRCRQAWRGRSKRESHRAMAEDGTSLSEGPCPHREGTKAGLERWISSAPRIESNYKIKACLL